MKKTNLVRIVHSDILIDGKVKVYIEKPDPKDCFHRLTCYLPLYELDDVYGFNDDEVNKYLEIIKSTAHLIIEFAKGKGVENASSF